MIYFIIALIFVLFITIDHRLGKKAKNYGFNFLYLILVLMLMFRYGQGSDYFNYEMLYSLTPTLNSPELFKVNLGLESGFLIIQSFFKTIGFSFTMFIAVISLIIMVLFYRFFIQFTNKSFYSLFYFFITYFLIYPYSTIRQAIVISFFMGIMLDLILKKKYFLYYLCIIFLFNIHYSILIVAIIPIIFKVNFNFKNTVIISILAILLSSEFILGNIISFIGIPRLNILFKEYNTNSISIFAFGLRIILYSIFVLFVDTQSKMNIFLLKFLHLSIIIYSLFIFMPLIASRLGVFFKFVDVALIALVMKSKIRFNRYVFLMFFVSFYAPLYLTHTIKGFIEQGKYVSSSVFDYPYVSIFNKENISKRQNKYTFETFYEIERKRNNAE